MADISATMVKELREKTQAGMMDCKNALVECEGDFERAVTFLKEKGLVIAQKKAARSASQGIIRLKIADDHKSGAICVKSNVTPKTFARIRANGIPPVYSTTIPGYCCPTKIQCISLFIGHYFYYIGVKYLVGILQVRS